MGWENMDGLFWCAEKLHFEGGREYILVGEGTKTEGLH